MTEFLPAALGMALLVTGRKLFWFFVGVVGFATGIQAAPMIFGLQPLWGIWALGLICGIIGALLALFFQQVAIVVGGFLAGSMFAFHLMRIGVLAPNDLIVLGGGITGALALFLLFDWALILLSSMIGAALIIDAVGRQLPAAPAVLIALCAIGVMVQGGWLLASRKPER